MTKHIPLISCSRHVSEAFMSVLRLLLECRHLRGGGTQYRLKTNSMLLKNPDILLDSQVYSRSSDPSASSCPVVWTESANIWAFKRWASLALIVTMIDFETGCVDVQSCLTCKNMTDSNYLNISLCWKCLLSLFYSPHQDLNSGLKTIS